MPRAGARIGQDKPDKRVFWAQAPAEVQDFSSTKVREALRNTGARGATGAKAVASATHMLGEAAFAYVRAHGLYHAAPSEEHPEAPTEAAPTVPTCTISPSASVTLEGTSVARRSDVPEPEEGY